MSCAIEYSGSPQRGLYFIMPEAPYPEKRLSFWTQGESEETHDWIPCYDDHNERATTEMIVTSEKPAAFSSTHIWARASSSMEASGTTTAQACAVNSSAGRSEAVPASSST